MWVFGVVLGDPCVVLIGFMVVLWGARVVLNNYWVVLRAKHNNALKDHYLFFTLLPLPLTLKQQHASFRRSNDFSSKRWLTTSICCYCAAPLWLAIKPTVAPLVNQLTHCWCTGLLDIQKTSTEPQHCISFYLPSIWQHYHSGYLAY